jgi:glycosyltransferase involved in cell wall biosynthesis
MLSGFWWLFIDCLGGKMMREDRHILMLPISYPTTYEASRGVFFEEIANALAENGIRVGVVAPVHIAREILQYKKIELGTQYTQGPNLQVVRRQYFGTPLFGCIYAKIRNVYAKKMIADYMRKNGRPDLIHVHCFQAGGPAVYCKKTMGIPYVVTEHFSTFQDGSLKKWQDRLAEKVFGESALNIAVSNKTAKVLQKKYQRPFRVVPNTVDTSFFTLPAENKRRSLGMKKLLTVGSLDANKNQELLIRAFSNAFSQQEDMQLTIVGAGSMQKRLRHLVHALGMEAKIRLAGHLSREDLRDAMWEADGYAQSRLIETFGVAIAEAQCCGLPVLSTRSGGPESIITNDTTGMLCESTEEAMSEALKEFVGKIYASELICSIAKSKFSHNTVASKLNAIYDEALLPPN